MGSTAMRHVISILLVLPALTLPTLKVDARASGNEQARYAQGKGPLYHSSASIYGILRNELDSSIVRNIRLKDDQANTTNMHQMFRIVNRKAGVRLREVLQMPTAFIICNQHAREVITAEICMWLIRLLAQDTKSLMQWPEFQQAIMSPGGVGSMRLDGNLTEEGLKAWVAGMTSKLRVEVVPVVNQEGRDYIKATGNFDQRKTVGTEVDLNRNWVTNRAEPGSGARELYRDGSEWQGPSALSEWQTRTLYNYMKAIPEASRAMFFDVHSGMWALMCPWGGKFDLSDLPNTTIDACQSFFDGMEPAFRDPAQPDKLIASGPGSGMLYKSEGSSDDTAYADLKFKYVMTVETYGPLDAYDGGFGYTCPPMRDWQAACTEQNMCGTTVCKNANGLLMMPSAGKAKHHAAAAAYAAAHKDRVSAAQASSTKLNTAADPFMSKLETGSSPQTFIYFNPHTAELYRAVVGRWLAAFLFALDKVVNQQV